MKLFDDLTEENFELFAAKHYNNPQCVDVAEFQEDLARYKYVKRLLRKYQQTGEIQERLVLNHLIVIYNMFGISAANRMSFYRIEEELWPALKTFLVYLNYLPENEKVEIPLDQNIVKVLRSI
jgi:ribosome-interacting GTPase 1